MDLLQCLQEQHYRFSLGILAQYNVGNLHQMVYLLFRSDFEISTHLTRFVKVIIF
jgi:hypothetical protein